MRSITIDFTKTPIEISNTVLGKRNEHNATQLIITPPAAMSADNSGVVTYCVAFQIGAHRISHSALYEKAETINVPLERSVTQVRVLSLQLEGYDGEENLIMKSERIDNLTFDESVDGEEYAGTGESNIGSQVSSLLTARHTHANGTTLDKLGEDANGNLTYNGSGIGTRPTSSVTIPNGYFYLQLAPSMNQSYQLVDISETFRENLEIKTIRFLYNGEWIDIHELETVDGVPYILNLSKTYSFANGEIALAVLTPIEIMNTMMLAIQDFAIESMEVVYYTDGGESDG